MNKLALLLLLVACKDKDAAPERVDPKPPKPDDTPKAAKAETIVKTLGPLDLVDADGAWVVRSIEGKLRVPFPGKPDLVDQSQEGVDMKIAVYEDTPASFAYLVLAGAVVEPVAGKQFDLKRVYDAARDGMAKKLDAKVTRDEDVTLLGLPARIIEIDHVTQGVPLHQRHHMIYVGPPTNIAFTIGGAYKQGDKAGSDRTDELVKRITLAK